MTSRAIPPEVVPFPTSRESADSSSKFELAALAASEPGSGPAECEGNFLVGIAFALAVEACAALAIVGLCRLWSCLR